MRYVWDMFEENISPKNTQITVTGYERLRKKTLIKSFNWLKYLTSGFY